MPKKLKVAILFGGRSAEHEVSLQSAQNVIRSLDLTRFLPILIGIDREGRWYIYENIQDLTDNINPTLFALDSSLPQVALLGNGPENQLIYIESNKRITNIDVIFPVLHGPFGEDGSVQGLSRLANTPCVGSDILGSAIGMDKDVMKRLLCQANILNAKSITLYHWSTKPDAIFLADQLGWPMFVKPANMGSSVGVSRASNDEELFSAIDLAFQFDQKIIIERAIIGREVEVAVLGNDHPQASEVGEIVPNTEFYSYDSKYVNGDGADLKIPANLTESQRSDLRKMAVEVFQLMESNGLARVDMFLTDADEIYVNEINTLPGFTNISMYPKLWEASGLKQQALVTKLIELAIERNQKRSLLKTAR